MNDYYDKGSLWFEEDKKAFRENRANFIMASLVVFVVILLLVVMGLTIGIIIGNLTWGDFSYWVPLAFIFTVFLIGFFVFRVFKGKPMRFYANGIQITKFGLKIFRSYTEFSRITEERNPVWGKAFHLHNKSHFGSNIIIPRYAPKMEKYISMIRDKIEEGEREEATPFVRG
jgi:hypothetical protein